MDLEDKYKKNFDRFLELLMNNIIIISLFIITLFFATLQFIYYLIKSTCKRDNDIYDAMMGKISKYHFIPLLFGSCLFGIGIFYNANRPGYQNIENDNLLYDTFSINTYGSLLSLFTYISVFIIYEKIDIKNETFLKSLLIKKGTFSCLISLSFYSLLNNISFCLCQKAKEIEEINIFSFFFIICLRGFDFIGIYYIFFSIMFKDIIVALMNLMIYLGMILEYKESYQSNIFIYIYIIMMIISIISMVIIYKKINAN
jgi:hypothetical protein